MIDGLPAPVMEIPKAQDDTVTFTLGVTNLKELAAARGLRYEVTIDGQEERVLKPDGTIIIRAPLKAFNMRGPKRKDPTIWMRAIKWHTYHGKPKDVNEVYLAHEDEAQNIVDLKFAVRETPPRRAVRRRE